MNGAHAATSTMQVPAFSRGAEFMHCEIYPGSPHVLTVVTAIAEPRQEWDSSDGLHERWNEPTRHLNGEGWEGPCGRDARS